MGSLGGTGSLQLDTSEESLSFKLRCNLLALDAQTVSVYLD